MYHDNPNVSDAMLVIINDGNGKQCGASYEQRLTAARNHDLNAFRTMALEYQYRGWGKLTRAETFTVRDELMRYYERHLSEF